MFHWPSLADLERLNKSRKAVTVRGTVTAVDPDLQDNDGALHQIVTVQVNELIAVPPRTHLAVGDRIYVAIRYGDASGFPEPIPDLAAGKPIEIRGAYIPPELAYDRPNAEDLGVIHFTHRPLGWIKYQGRLYK